MDSEEEKQQTRLTRTPERLTIFSGPTCELDAEGHCITCSDEAIYVRVLHVEEGRGLARVEVDGNEEEVDITLIEHVAPGATLLVHGGVAIALLEEAPHA